ncbi:MAG: hypothetical protein RR404_02295 [Bacilli bacterium]
MEDKGMINKKIIIICISIVIIGFIAIIAYFLLKEKDKKEIIDNEPSIDEPTLSDTTNIYGKFINEKDTNSYLIINKDGTFSFIMNICEGYLDYNNNNYKMEKFVNKKPDSEIYETKLIITSKKSNEIVKLEFKSSLSSATGTVVEWIGPYSCSESYNYKRQ